MNIFGLSVEEFEKEFQKILDSYSDEELIEILEKNEVKVKEVDNQ